MASWTRWRQVVLVGYSLGGLVAAHLAARKGLSSSVDISGLVLLAPGFGLIKRLQETEVDATTGVMYLPSNYVPEGKLAVSQQLLHDLLHNYPADATIAQTLKLPTFIAQGEDDDTVAIEDVVAFHSLLGTGSAASNLLRIGGDDGGDHRLNHCIDQILVEVESFLQQHGLLVAKKKEC
eukprot:COSAG02_NODE_9164_length_2305_cov_1.947869_2_plen_179_part_00